MTLKFIPISSNAVDKLQNGGSDYYDNLPHRLISDGDGIPCRHCLEDVKKGDEFLALAFSPFDEKRAYAEVGPIFIHAKKCSAYNIKIIPPSFLKREHYIMRAYSKQTKGILYGSGKRVAANKIEAAAANLFEKEDADYIHLRSASYTCFACRIERDLT